jgi:hypothetical protein
MGIHPNLMIANLLAGQRGCRELLSRSLAEMRHSRWIMKTTDELVRELADREAIRDLPARYCDCLWRQDLDGPVDLFTDDARFVVKGLELEAVSHGRAD